MRLISRALLIVGALGLALAPSLAFGANMKLPAGYAPGQSIGYGAIDGTYTPVTPGNPLPVSANGDVTTAAVTGVSAINTDLLTNTVSGWYDAANYHSGSIDIYTTAGISAGVVTFEQTNDTANASAGVVMFAFDGSSLTANPVSSLTLAASAVKHYDFPILSRYIRFRVSTGVAGGTVGATAILSQLSFSSTRLNVMQATGASLNATVVGNVTEDSATSDKPIVVGGYVRTATAPTTLIAGDASRLTVSNGAALIIKPFSVPQADWQYTGTLTTTTAAAAKSAGAASIKNYVTAFQYQNTSATATTVIILDGATVLHTLYAPANMVAPAVMDFPTPLQGTAATALNVNCGTTGANVLVNVQGYQAP